MAAGSATNYNDNYVVFHTQNLNIKHFECFYKIFSNYNIINLSVLNESARTLKNFYVNAINYNNGSVYDDTCMWYIPIIIMMQV